MAYNGSGTYVLPAPEYPAIPGTTILAEDYNEILSDLATALSSVLVRDGQSAMTGNLNMGTFGLTNVTSLTGLTAVTADAAGLTVNGTLTFAIANTVTFNGTTNFTGTTTVPTKAAGTNTTDAASTAFVQLTAMNAALPGQSAATTGFFPRSNGAAAVWSEVGTKGTDIASAATVDLTSADGDFRHITGTTTITAITIPVGAERTLIFDAALTLTHGAALLLPGAANILTAANDRVTVRGDTAGAIVTNYAKADGTAVKGGLTLLAVLTPTAAANIDFLSIFTSTYDGYLIRGDGITNNSGTNDQLNLRFATAGAVDTGSNYYEMQSGSSDAASDTFARLIQNVLGAGQGVNFELKVSNVNDAVRLKSASFEAVTQSTAVPAYNAELGARVAYKGANTVSGLRFYWNAGANFAATGKVRVYGIANS